MVYYICSSVCVHVKNYQYKLLKKVWNITSQDKNVVEIIISITCLTYYYEEESIIYV